MAYSYSLVVTSCGRMDLLRRTIDSFKAFADIQPSQIIVSENSCNKELLPTLKEIFGQFKVAPQITVHEENRGQIWAIDHAYSQVDEDLIFHLEDDWVFYDTDFIWKSGFILEKVPEIFQVSLRRRFDGSKGAQHPIDPTVRSINDGTRFAEYGLYLPNYLGVYDGFSFNPNLRRLQDYYLAAPYKQYGGEEALNALYRKHSFKYAYLVNQKHGYCWHSGEGTTLPGANS